MADHPTVRIHEYLSPRYAAAQGAATFAALTALLLLPVWFAGPGAVVGWAFGDMPASYYFWRAFGFASIARGEIPWWNHHVFCGHPFAGNYETALFYPLNFPFLLLPPWLAINLSVTFHLWMAGFGTFLLGRLYGFTRLASLFSGVVFLLCTPVLGRVYAGHLTIVNALAWLPFLLLVTERIVRGDGYRWAGIGAITYGACVLAGHPQVMYYNALAVALYALLRSFVPGICIGKAACRARAFLRVTVMGICGALLGAIPLTISWHAQLEGSRQAMTLDSASVFSLAPGDLAGFLAPWFFGDGIASPYWGAWYSWEIAVYTGIAPLLLLMPALVAGFALFHDEAARGMRALSILALVALIIALGRTTPLFTVLFGMLPGFSLFRGPSKFTPLVALCLAILAGYGLNTLIAAKGERRRWLGWSIAAGAGLSFLALGAIFMNVTREGYINWMTSIAERGANTEFNPALFGHTAITEATLERMSGQCRRALMVILGGSAILALLWWKPAAVKTLATVLLVYTAVEMYQGCSQYIASCDPSRVRLPVMSGLDPLNERLLVIDPARTPNAALVRDMRAANGLEPVYPRRLGELRNAINGLPRDHYDSHVQAPIDSPLWEMAGVTQVIGDGELISLERPASRARLYTSWIQAGAAADAWRMMADGNPQRLPVLEDAPPSPPERAGDSTAARVVEESPRSVRVEIETDRQGVLLLADSWHPGWTAFVDGERRPMHAANVAFRGVIVNAGDSEVLFVYTPPGLRAGGWMTILGLLGLCLLLLQPFRGNKLEPVAKRADSEQIRPDP